jgi:hypothetical protein
VCMHRSTALLHRVTVCCELAQLGDLGNLGQVM